MFREKKSAASGVASLRTPRQSTGRGRFGGSIILQRGDRNKTQLGRGLRNSYRNCKENLRPAKKTAFEGTYPARNSDLFTLDFENAMTGIICVDPDKKHTIRKTGDFGEPSPGVIFVPFSPLTSTEFKNKNIFVIRVAERMHIQGFAS